MAEGESHKPRYSHDDPMAEYFRLVEVVAAFDQRLLAVKSWGVTSRSRH
jgi:hypothetical protein